MHALDLLKKKIVLLCIASIEYSSTIAELDKNKNKCKHAHNETVTYSEVILTSSIQRGKKEGIKRSKEVLRFREFILESQCNEIKMRNNIGYSNFTTTTKNSRKEEMNR